MKKICLILLSLFVSACVSTNAPLPGSKAMHAGVISTEKNQQVYRNPVVGVVLSFGPEWRVLTGEQIQQHMDAGEFNPPGQKLIAKGCHNMLLCAMLPKSGAGADVVMLSAAKDFKPEAFIDMKYDLTMSLKKKYGAQGFLVDIAPDVIINGQKYAHIVVNKKLNDKTLVMDQYITPHNSYLIAFQIVRVGDENIKRDQEILHSLSLTQATGDSL